MRDLLQYIRALLSGDPTLLLAFAEAGESQVWVIAPHQRTLAAYPRIILNGEEGAQQEYGENAPPKFYDGRVTLEIVTRKSAQCQEPRAALEAIKLRCGRLLLGYAGSDGSDPLPGIKGQRFAGVEGGDGPWSVTRFYQTRPTRYLTVTDPTYQRHLTTYAVQLCRTSARI